MANEPLMAVLPLGAFNGATEVPLVQVSPLAGITILGAALVGPSAGTAIGGKLVTMSNLGTPAINGTIGTFDGTIVTAAGVRHALTITAGYVAKDYWIGFDQTSGTVPAGTNVAITYTPGK